jgi:uncharacterized protein (DUF305 family)
MATMQREMQKVHYSGDPDVDFAAMMIPLHQGAIEMAEVEMQFGSDPRLRRLAQEIVATEQSEVELMDGALQGFPLASLRPAQKNWSTR